MIMSIMKSICVENSNPGNMIKICSDCTYSKISRVIKFFSIRLLYLGIVFKVSVLEF